MRRNCLDDSTCPVARSLDSVGDWWTLLIVRDAMLGLRQFGSFSGVWGWLAMIDGGSLRRHLSMTSLQLTRQA